MSSQSNEVTKQGVAGDASGSSQPSPASTASAGQAPPDIPSRRQAALAGHLDPPPPAAAGYRMSPMWSHSPSHAYGSYSSYSPYGDFSRFSRYSYGMDPNYSGDDAIQRAEAGTRRVLSSLETLVFATSSLASVVEGSYEAAWSACRAVLAMAEHIDSVRTQLSGLLRRIRVLGRLRDLLSTILGLFGIHLAPSATRPAPPSRDADVLSAPGSAASRRAVQPSGITATSPSWPIWLFVALTVGLPVLAWRLIKNDPQLSLDSRDRRKPVKARAAFDFSASNPDELTVRKGETVTVFPPGQKAFEPEGWVFVQHADDESRTGLVPANHLRYLPSDQAGERPLEQAWTAAANNATSASAAPTATAAFIR